jgi:hypothetical protein
MTHVPNNDLADGYSAGQIDALRKLDLELIERNAAFALQTVEGWREILDSRCSFALRYSYCSDDEMYRIMHSMSDARSKARSDVRAQKQLLSIVRAIRNELGRRVQKHYHQILIMRFSKQFESRATKGIGEGDGTRY